MSSPKHASGDDNVRRIQAQLSSAGLHQANTDDPYSLSQGQYIVKYVPEDPSIVGGKNILSIWWVEAG